MHDGVWKQTHGLATIVAVAVIIATLAPVGRARADEPKPQGTAAAPPTVARDAGVRAAAAEYANHFNERNYDKLADQWTERAELVEGEGRLLGRSAIMRSIKAWLDRHPQAQLAIEVSHVEFPADSLARVSGRMTFTSKAGAKPVVSRFVSLRVLENDRWRLAESVVMPSQSAALDELDWLVGTWQNDAERAGFAAEATFSRPLGDACIVGRTTIKPKQGKNREIMQIIHPDRASGQVRTWIFDSTGARAEGVVESDGTSYHQSLVGTPAESAKGGVARWVQVISPTGEGRFTVHAIERSVDGVPLPDGQPMDFRKVR
jgi:uncharacterized protein (TIGR02246 family)